jgi:CheY-like chemotaxis protein
MPKILVVDDEQDIRECMEYLVKDGDLEFTLASDGQEGLEQILNHRFDCIISDIKMPRLDGIEMLKRMRKAGIHTPIIFISAFANDEFEHSVTDYGAVRLLHKLELTQIKSHVLDAIKSAKEIRALEKAGDDASDFLGLVNKTK